MDKPKEFWIAPEIQKPISDFIPMYRKAYDDKGDNGQEIHVIEYSAYEQLMAKHEMLRERFNEALKIIKQYIDGQASVFDADDFARSLEKK